MKKIWVVTIIGVVILALIWTGISIYPDWLWFNNLGFSPVYWTMLLSSYGLGIVIALLLLLMISLNLLAAKRLGSNIAVKQSGNPIEGLLAQFGLTGRKASFGLILLSLYVCYMVVSAGSQKWGLFMRFVFQQPFDTMDPIFGKDVGFYLFSLPFYLFIQKGLLILIGLTVLVTLGWYIAKGGIQIIGDIGPTESGQMAMPRFNVSTHAKSHLSFLASIVILLLSWGYILKMYGVLYSTSGPAFGASYVDVNFNIIVYKILTVISIVYAILLIINAFRFKIRQVILGGGIWIVAILLLSFLVPLMIQQFVVKPNELKKESPYIAHNIQHTRQAYNLDKIAEADFQVDDRLSESAIRKNEDAIRNIRIWDERPLLQTYRQIQSIRLYYDFNNVDVDRYMINDQYRQVMLAARELVVDQLPAQANTWVNRHLIYTHGYGLASSSVNEVSSEGLPHLLVKDLPPSYEPDLRIDRPEIYYGEKTMDFVLVKTKAKEFDYPKGDKNVYSVYEGDGGIPVSSFARRLLFAIQFLDPQILFTQNITSESRIMFNRRVTKRTRAVAPFLDYDADPYLVISQGRLFWIIDAYTTSNMYPYSFRSRGRLGNKELNYIRNSVKVSIDAYNGKMSFYVMDESDPILSTYVKIFPDLFKPFELMPDDLKKHIRYPKDLFKIQVETYAKYHMQDVQVFYNQEDLWQTPDELYGDTRQEMEPYYLIVRLPNEETEEFFLMLPFTPSQKDNMIGWVAARSDLANYGDLLVYKLPKEKLVYGPMQIEARIDQQTDISRELSLWGQRGSRVIRGNLLAIPFGNTFIYVEPVYLEAMQEKPEEATPKTSQGGGGLFGGGAKPVSNRTDAKSASLPELKRVIVAFGNRLVMEDNLDLALNSVLDGQLLSAPISTVELTQGKDIADLAVLALEYYNKAKEHIQKGDWAAYGDQLKNMEDILKEISRLENKD